MNLNGKRFQQQHQCHSSNIDQFSMLGIDVGDEAQKIIINRKNESVDFHLKTTSTRYMLHTCSVIRHTW